MTRRKSTRSKRSIESYEHRDKERLNNPPVGLVTPETDPDAGPRTYAYDPHLDPQLHWAGKAEHTSFEVTTVSLHVHERIDPLSIVEAVRRQPDAATPVQLSLFQTPEENPPIRQAIEFYRHAHGWSNRLVAGDSLLVMNSLLEKEGLAGQVQMIYIDPPYGIKYGSNFQPFVNKRDVKDGKDEDLTAEPEQIRAFRDTWELDIHSYLTYLRDRLLLARELLHESGSVFVQISDENVHHVRELMDEVFGVGNFVSMIAYKTTGGARQQNAPKRVADFILWYSKNRNEIKFRRLYREQEIDTGIFGEVEEKDGRRRSLAKWEKQHPERLPDDLRLFTTLPVHSKSSGDRTPREFAGKLWTIPTGSWRYSLDGLKRLAEAGRIVQKKTVIRTISYFDDFPYEEYTSIWNDTSPELTKIYAVQTSPKPIERCLLMTTDPGDLVFDPTCVRKGTGVLTPLNPPDIGGTSTPSPLAGRVGEGTIPIECIQPGDFVLAHDGKPHRVLRAIRKPYRGLIVGIRHSHCHKTLWLTGDHRVLCRLRTLSYGAERSWRHIPAGHFERARALRRDLTPAERKLWRHLRGGQLGVKFRKQHPIGPYIADFYCWEKGLVVECDGDSHYTSAGRAYDRERDSHLSSLGLTLLRFPNTDINTNLERVLERVTETLAQVEPADDHYRQWRRADSLRVGDVVFWGHSLKTAEVTQVCYEETTEEVYDLEIEDAHSFITEVCAVHNCGSGTTAYVAERWGRRWITCDTSCVALTLARTRLMTAVYDYYELAHPQEGVGSGFVYKTVPHVTLKFIANNEPPGQETLYDQPAVDRKKTRVSGPFTVEAVPAPAVQSVDDLLAPVSPLRAGGIEVGHIRFARLEPLPGCRWLHAPETRAASLE